MAIAAFSLMLVLLQLIQTPMRLLDCLLGYDQSFGQLTNVSLDA